MTRDLSRLRSQLITASVDLCAYRCGAIMKLPGDAELARATEVKFMDLLDRSAAVAMGTINYIPCGEDR